MNERHELRNPPPPGNPDFDTFVRRAEELFLEIPGEYLEGITGVAAHEETRRHPQVEGYYTLGECGRDEVIWLGDPGNPSSRIHIYYGSFAALAGADPAFDWEAELKETILHEVRHHIEDRAGIPDLIERDAEEEALARFHAGEELPAGWYRAGEELEPRLYRVADDLFLELNLTDGALKDLRGSVLDMIVLGAPQRLHIPEDAKPGEILSAPLLGLPDTPGSLHVILDLR